MVNPLSPQKTASVETKVSSIEQIIDWPIPELRALASHLEFDLRRHLFAHLGARRSEALRMIGASQGREVQRWADIAQFNQDQLIVDRARELKDIGILRQA
jgi:hypothetical protein